MTVGFQVCLRCGRQEEETPAVICFSALYRKCFPVRSRKNLRKPLVANYSRKLYNGYNYREWG